MFSHFFRQLFGSFGIFFRTIRAFFTRRLNGLGARLRGMLNFSRHATKVATESFQGAAAAIKKPTKREDYIETKRLFISKSFLIKLVIGLIILGCLIYFLVWPFLLSRFFTAHFWQNDEDLEDWSGKVVVYYDEDENHPMYEGRLKDGVLQGKGKSYDENGLITYEGTYVDGVQSGSGTCYESGVLQYCGELLDGVYDGEGVLYRDGVIAYEGGFLQGFAHNSGKEYDDEGLLVYEGGFQNGLYHGNGILYHPNGAEQYVGSFTDGMYDGKGKLTDENGHLVYEGGFSAGLYDGKGKLMDDDGQVLYDEHFVQGVYDGKGRLYESGQLVYEGSFTDGLYEPEGSVYEDSVPLYVGGLKEGLKNGEGTEYRADGSVVYKGGFSNDLRNGEGTEYRPDSSIRYTGGFADGKYHGSGVLYLDDNRGRIEAVFAAGEPDGTLQWFVDEKLWYSGCAVGLVPDGYGEIYARNGKKIYSGEMDRGTIDGEWILSLTANEVREAFSEATIIEEPAKDGGFFVLNRELGVVVRCMYRSEESETSVFSVWISRKNTKDAWQDVAIFEKWTEDFKTDGSISELMFWQDADAFDEWVEARFEGEPVDRASFPEHEMQKLRYFFDGWYCTAAIDPGTGIPNMVSWTVDGELQPNEEDALLPDEVKDVQEQTDKLLVQLGLAENEEDNEELPSQQPDTDTEKVADDIQMSALQTYLLESETLSSKKELIDCLLDYGENTQMLLALESTQAQVLAQLTDAEQRLSMGSGTKEELDSLQLQVDAYQLRIMQCAANQAKALLKLQDLVPFEPEQLNLSELLVWFDPYELTEEKIIAQTAENDTITVKTSLINLRVSYETVLYAVKSLEQAKGAVKTAADAYSRGEADLLYFGKILCDQSDAVVQLYGALAAFAREVNALNLLTNGWLAQQIGWLDGVFEKMT